VTATAVDPAIAAHEARHCAAALLLGLDPIETRADNPSPEAGGQVSFHGGVYGRPREQGVMILLGGWNNPAWPPKSPSSKGATSDERQLADAVDGLGIGPRGYELLLADARHLAATAEFKALAGTIEVLLLQGCVLRRPQLEQIHRHACGHAQLRHKTVKAAARVAAELGEFSALAAAYSVDRDRDQIVRGAFRRTIERWRASDKRIPLHWNHSPSPSDIIGTVDPGSMRETREGLFVRGKVDLDNSEVAREAWRSMKANAVSLSFGYLTTDSFKRSDGIQELRELDLFEISITPAPANPDTRILSVKSTGLPQQEEERAPEPRMLNPDQEAIRTEARDQMLRLLGSDGPSDPASVMEREEKRQVRELRRECERVRLRVALGYDPFKGEEAA
jgi:uncharacterized protein